MRECARIKQITNKNKVTAEGYKIVLYQMVEEIYMKMKIKMEKKIHKTKPQ